jgi:hypothetical protein
MTPHYMSLMTHPTILKWFNKTILSLKGGIYTSYSSVILHIFSLVACSIHNYQVSVFLSYWFGSWKQLSTKIAHFIKDICNTITAKQKLTMPEGTTVPLKFNDDPSY